MKKLWKATAHEISINNNNSQKWESKLCVIVSVTPNLKWEHILKLIFHVLLRVCMSVKHAIQRHFSGDKSICSHLPTTSAEERTSCSSVNCCFIELKGSHSVREIKQRSVPVARCPPLACFFCILNVQLWLRRGPDHIWRFKKLKFMKWISLQIQKALLYRNPLNVF